MFKKLLAIRIVANNFLGFCNRVTTGLLSFVCSEILIMSVLEREKKATSVPEIKAEQKSNKNRKRIATIDMLSI